MNHHRLLQLRLSGVSIALALAVCAEGTARAAEQPEPLPDDPAASSAVGDGVPEITQKREQNAVTSVRVRRGTNTYYVTPAEQIPSSEGGGRAAQWEIFQFRPGRPRDIQSAPPPSLDR
jgi:hypothetical protein